MLQWFAFWLSIAVDVPGRERGFKCPPKMTMPIDGTHLEHGTVNRRQCCRRDELYSPLGIVSNQSPWTISDEAEQPDHYEDSSYQTMVPKSNSEKTASEILNELDSYITFRTQATKKTDNQQGISKPAPIT